jgi:hypothetical protein
LTFVSVCAILYIVVRCNRVSTPYREGSMTDEQIVQSIISTLRNCEARSGFRGDKLKALDRALLVSSSFARGRNPIIARSDLSFWRDKVLSALITASCGRLVEGSTKRARLAAYGEVHPRAAVRVRSPESFRDLRENQIPVGDR